MVTSEPGPGPDWSSRLNESRQWWGQLESFGRTVDVGGSNHSNKTPPGRALCMQMRCGKGRVSLFMCLFQPRLQQSESFSLYCCHCMRNANSPIGRRERKIVVVCLLQRGQRLSILQLYRKALKRSQYKRSQAVRKMSSGMVNGGHIIIII